MDARKMKRVLAIVFSIACGILALAYLTRPSRQERVAAPSIVSRFDDADSADRHPAQALDAPQGTPTERVEVLDTERDTPERAALSTDACVIVGNLFLAGHPAAGARLELPSVRIGRHWFEPSTLAKADGSFELHFPLEVAESKRLRVRLRGHELLQEVDAVPGRRIDLGNLLFPPGATVVGRVIDAHGYLPAVEMWVRARAPTRASGRVRKQVSEDFARVPVDPATHSFLLENLPGRELVLALELPDWPEADHQKFEAHAGARSAIEFVYDGRNLSRAIWLRCESPAGAGSAPMEAFLPERGHAWLQSTWRARTEPVLFRGVLLFKDVEAGSHELVVDDPRYLPVHIPGLRAGEGVSISLVGSSTIELHPIDAQTGLPLTSYRAWLTRGSGYGVDGSVLLQEEHCRLPPDGVYRGIVPG